MVGAGWEHQDSSSHTWAEGGDRSEARLGWGAACQQVEQDRARGQLRDLCSKRELPCARKKEARGSRQPDVEQRLDLHRLEQGLLAGSLRVSCSGCCHQSSFQASSRVRTRAAPSAPALPVASFHRADFSSTDEGALLAPSPSR